jgi:hypothetical protein
MTLRCAKSWDIGVDIIKDKSFWYLAAKLGTGFVAYMKAFRAMRVGFSSGSFACGLFVAKVPENGGSTPDLS